MHIESKMVNGFLNCQQKIMASENPKMVFTTFFDWLNDLDMFDEIFICDSDNNIVVSCPETHSRTIEFSDNCIEFSCHKSKQCYGFLYLKSKPNQKNIQDLITHLMGSCSCKLTMIELQQSELRFRELIETTSDWMWELDTEANFTYVSPRIYDVLGYKPEEVIGTSGYDLMPPAEAQKISEQFDQFVNEGKPFRGLININVHKDGRKVYLESNGNPFFDEQGNLLGYRGIDRNITDRVLAQQALKRRESEFKALSENSTDQIFRFNKETYCVYANEASSKLFNKHLTEIIGKRFDEIDVPQELIQAWKKGFQYTVNKQKSIIQSIELKIEGTPVVLDIRFHPEINSEQQMDSVLCVSRDITEQQILEDQIRHIQKMESVGQLAGGVAHDFNNMLCGILGAADILKGVVSDRPFAKDLTQTIVTASERAATLTQQLLDFSRKGKLISSKIDIHSIISDGIAILERSVDKRITVCTRFEANESMVVGDPTQLQNSIINLGLNARDAMPKGGVLSLTTQNISFDHTKESSIELDQSIENWIKVTVQDNGSGMPEDVMERIFEPFYTTKPLGEGTGLGLAAVYGAIKDHNGAIFVDSKPNCGTTFNIYLPLAKQAKPISEFPTEPLLKGKGCVLLVDDEEIVRTTGSMILKSLDYQVLLATNGEEALSIYREKQSKIDLVLLDMVMPKLSGTDCFLALKKINPNAKIILSSGYSDESIICSLEKQGICAFLKKPYRSRELSRVLAEVLGK
jgi:PAS domain S-box-containing protein